ncbi:restriction endonuclease subunit S [Pontiellaceae bacterium B1224]|nr:restriction endonuclease subunit S [Pontiellaceae bacterium B1224]
MKRISDIITRNKTAVTVEDGTIYKQVTIRTNYKGVTLRGTKEGSTIGTKNQFSVSGGQFILSRIDARNGAFGIIPDELEGAIITNDFLAFDINEDEVEREFFNVFLQSPIFLEACIKASRGNTNRKRVNEKFFLNYEINLPPLAEQHQLIKKINTARAHLSIAQHEIAHQEALLGKLKQAILQEAIQGKLTEDWRATHPDTEPAAELLKRIQKEKAQLIADKKLRKEKPLPKITPEEIPFDIPENWEWCRFGTYALFERGKFSARPRGDKRFFGGPYPFIQIGSLDKHGSVITSSPQTLNEEGLAVSKIFEAGTIAIAIVGGTIGNLGVLGKNMCFTDSVVGVRPTGLTNQDFILQMLRSKQSEIQFAAYQRSGQPNISLPNLTDLLIPLPPLTEQAAIVERVEALMETCRALEKEIDHSRTHAAHLLQAVLKEAFASTSPQKNLVRAEETRIIREALKK